MKNNREFNKRLCDVKIKQSGYSNKLYKRIDIFEFDGTMPQIKANKLIKAIKKEHKRLTNGRTFSEISLTIKINNHEKK